MSSGSRKHCAHGASVQLLDLFVQKQLGPQLCAPHRPFQPGLGVPIKLHGSTHGVAVLAGDVLLMHMDCGATFVQSFHKASHVGLVTAGCSICVLAVCLQTCSNLIDIFSVQLSCMLDASNPKQPFPGIPGGHGCFSVSGGVATRYGASLSCLELMVGLRKSLCT